MIRRQSMLWLAAGIVVGVSGRAQAQAEEEVYQAGPEPAEYAEDPNAAPGPYGPPPLPPEAEASAVAGPGGAFCYNGPHPVDTRVAAGGAWDETAGPHTHFYAPFDLRLFRLEGNCYNFIGDPQDFGYQGQVYSYYGAHPVHVDYGGGWCFMVGGHSHWWQPWSTNFVVVNSWYYWNGPYDRVFWNYWPYYSYYYQSYYPHYYGGGRFTRQRHFDVAPRINHVPSHYARGWRGGHAGSSVPATRSGGNWRGGPPGTVAPAPRHGSAAAGNWSGSSGGWRGGAQAPAVAPSPPAAPSGGWRGGHSAPAPAAAPSSGGWNGGARSSPAAAPSSGGWRGGATPSAAPPAPRPSTPSRMPSTPMPSSSGGWKGGGSSSGHTGSARGGWRH